MSERRQQIRGAPRNMGTAVTPGPVPLTTPQCCTQRPGVKFVQANVCPCQAANIPCTSGCPSENFRNRGPTQAPTTPRLTTNVIKTITEDQEAAPTIFHATPPRSFSTNTHWRSHPASSQEETSGLTYRRAPTLPTWPQRSPRPPPQTLPNWRPVGAAK